MLQRMVEVRAQVLGGPVHLAGDTVQVCVTITVPSLDPALRAQSRLVVQYSLCFDYKKPGNLK